MKCVLSVLFLVLGVAVPSVMAWGNMGHQVTAAIAQPLLTTAAQNGVNDLLGGSSLSDVATWADTVKNHPAYSWTKTMHYINTPDWACTYKHSRDCSDEICVTGALYNFTNVLADFNNDQSVRTDALKFIIHFAGDVHQPLHVGFTTDEGGNTIRGDFEGKKENLHAVWDTAMLEKYVKEDYNDDQDSYTQYLSSQISGAWKAKAKAWGTCTSGNICADDFASETVKLACSNAYVDSDGNKIDSGFDLGDDYYNFNSPIIDEQMAKGGVRLASVLNAVFSSSRDALRMNDIVVFGEALPSN